eukprot:TRINITY_DN63623_c0_g1_i1.p1 TRINITY_DN63623_c0_g1~~TRINITY_DN63623_c0_g1_i1.p1  ORF type:complete len:384 (+),score=61.75 TRINITY_DN63623_c0_g1_i1:118-1269(+)
MARVKRSELTSANGKHHEDQSVPLDPPVPSRPEAQVKVELDSVDQRIFGLSVKWLSLLALTLQTAGQALLIKWSKSTAVGVPYLSSTAVFFTEVVKFTVAFALVIWESGGLQPGFQNLSVHFTQSPPDLLKALVPSLIYTIQNNLMYYSLEKLSAPVQQILYQMKIITTAGLGVLMLGKKLTVTQWVSCFLLTVGVAMVQWPRSTRDVIVHESSKDVWLSGDQAKGFVAVLVACFTSGFAGVWIQKMLQQTTASIWMRNVQLGLFGSIMAFLVAMFQDSKQILKDGFTQGYDASVVSVILMTAFGGLLCALMLKHAGATHGCFSTALSIVLTSFISQVFLKDTVADGLFFLGAITTINASLLFAGGFQALAPRGMRQSHPKSG